MRYLMLLIITVFFSGCATWEGIKQDTSDAFSWTKSKVHSGAEYIEKKTQ